jgi:hypothetical protein
MTTVRYPNQFQPQERATAMGKGLAQYFTGRPCKNGHIANRKTSNGACIECSKIIQKKCIDNRLSNNPNWYKEDYAKNIESHKKRLKKYRLKHPERVKESYLNSSKKRMPQKAAAERARQAKKIQATPLWLTKEDWLQMDAVYICAKETSNLAGFNCNVDHIVPLKGKDVCGLHVPWNLRVVSTSYNSKKHNKLDSGIFFEPSITGGVLVHESALPWNWRK